MLKFGGVVGAFMLRAQGVLVGAARGLAAENLSPPLFRFRIPFELGENRSLHRCTTELVRLLSSERTESVSDVGDPILA